MGIPQQEPPTTPPELTPSALAAWHQSRSKAVRDELDSAPVLIKKILTTGQGHLHTASSLGLPVSYDVADLWDMILSDQNPTDLALLAGLALSPDDEQLRLKVAAFLLPQIARFVVIHADRVADLRANQELSEGAAHV